MENEELRKLKEKEDRKRYRKLEWQEFKWLAQEILIKILLMIVLPALLSVAISVETIVILRKIVG